MAGVLDEGVAAEMERERGLVGRLLVELEADVEREWDWLREAERDDERTDRNELTMADLDLPCLPFESLSTVEPLMVVGLARGRAAARRGASN